MLNIFKKKLKYVVIGSGATGGFFACYLKDAGKDVTLITKYKNTDELIKKSGITLNCVKKGKRKYDIKTGDNTSYNKKADIIFLCIRQPDIIDTISFIKKISNKDTIVIPICNGYLVGEFLSYHIKNVLNASFIGKCRCYNQLSTEYYQLQEALMLTLSTINNNIDKEKIYQLYDDLNETGIKTTFVDNNSFKKINFTRILHRLPIEACCFYYNINAKEITEEKKKTFEELYQELLLFAKTLNIQVDQNSFSSYCEQLEYLKSKEEKYTYSQIIEDIKSNKKPEVDFWFFAILELAKQNNIHLPTLQKISNKLEKYNTLRDFLP